MFILDFLVNIYHENLLKNQKALNYLKLRGINENTIKYFKLGYCDNNIGFRESLRQNFDFKEIKESLMFFNDKENYKDIFNNRIIIPIMHFGITVQITSRYIGDMWKKIGLKTPHLHRKGKMIYALNHDVIYDKRYVFLTEGAFDCMTLHQQGFPAIGIFGCNRIPKELIPDLKKKMIYIVFDNDKNLSGNNGAQRVANMLFNNNIPCKIIILPSNKNKMDVNEYFVNHNREEFLSLVERADTFIGIKKYSSNIALNTNGLPSILSVVSKYGDIIYSGSRPRMICPFHKEKYPSMVIYEDSFFCFGCGKGGNVVHFFREINIKNGKYLTYNEAKKLLLSKIKN